MAQQIDLSMIPQMNASQLDPLTAFRQANGLQSPPVDIQRAGMGLPVGNQIPMGEQQQSPELQHLADVLNQYTQNKTQQSSGNDFIAQILANRQSPESVDVTRSLLNSATTGSYSSPEMEMAQRYKAELSPYTDIIKAQSELGNSTSAKAGGATGVLMNRLMAADTSLNPASALQLIQTGFRQNTKMDPNGNIVNLPGSLAAIQNINNAKQTGTNTSDLAYKPSIAGAETTAKDTAKLDVERQANMAKAQSALVGLEQQSNLVTSTIDKATKLISPLSTGYGSYLSGLPNTDARALNNALNTIKANIGFDKLQQMRENSPTGGALGQVSDFENRLLQAVNGALDPAQTDQLKENLASIKALYPAVLAEKKRAFQADYGKYTMTQPNNDTSGDDPNRELTPEELIRYNQLLGQRGN